MSSQKTPQIDLDREYPCPCRRRGTLRPIVLTEALGCDRCQQIFVPDASARGIEQLSTAYPYKRAWRWTGNRWVAANRSWRERYRSLTVTIAIIIFIGVLPLVLQSLSVRIIFGIIVAALIVSLPIFLLWISYRR